MRHVQRSLPVVGGFEGYELYANLGVALIGVVVMVLSDRLPEE